MRYLGVQIIKIASSDINDWVLIEKIAKTRKPVIVSTGGLSLKDVDDLVTFFENRNIPLAINHCISKYPSQKGELELNQIDFLKSRYPDHVIGFRRMKEMKISNSYVYCLCKRGKDI